MPVKNLSYEDMQIRHIELTTKVIDGLYTESMVLADEARSYFDSDRARAVTPVEVSVAFSCESLKVTTRLMHVIAWLLNQKAVRAGELSARDNMNGLEDLGYAPATDDLWLEKLPQEAQTLISASEDLYYRVQRVAEGMARPANDEPEPLAMIERLRAAF
jgi:regulator of CtrA degradation